MIEGEESLQVADKATFSRSVGSSNFISNRVNVVSLVFTRCPKKSRCKKSFWARGKEGKKALFGRGEIRREEVLRARGKEARELIVDEGR